MIDSCGRRINYMRISITDRCDLRCRYCMPEEGIEKVSMSRILTYEEILRICRAAVKIGITRFKITGGEPLVRKGCTGLVREMKKIAGVEQVTLTTNGQQLSGRIEELKEAGIDGINISMDSLREDRYSYITGGGELRKTLEAIDRSIASGISTRINCLLQKQFNEDETADFAAFAFDKGLDVRFIEIMPVGFGNPDEGLSNDDVLKKLKEKHPELEKDERLHGNGPAVYYRLPGTAGAIGLISAMHHSFCSSCNRIRLTSQGLLKPCLCYEDGIDLRPVLAEQESSEEMIKEALREAVMDKPDGHTFFDRAGVETKLMSQIGG
ncbi:MAG: GTP 3',8-cyclase MoaA [Bacillota bacterium]|nr:GTP 3',8-cyclase MoaA [Bacillota bacterium]